MKVFIIKEEDLENLKLLLQKDPFPGILPNSEKWSIYDEAKRFYTYYVLGWVNKISESK